MVLVEESATIMPQRRRDLDARDVDVAGSAEGRHQRLTIKANRGRPFAKYGARFLVRAGKHVVAAGKARARHVVIEFRGL